MNWPQLKGNITGIRVNTACIIITKKTKLIYRSLVLLSSSTLEELFFFFPSAWFVADDGDTLLGEEGLEPDVTLKVIDLGLVVACVAGANRGGGGGGKVKDGEKQEREKGSPPLQSSFLFPSLQSPTPFDAYNAGYRESGCKVNNLMS